MGMIIGCGLFMVGMVAFTAWGICRMASDADDEAEASGTGNKAPITDARVRELLSRERYESNCI